jgi:hypothetical protein
MLPSFPRLSMQAVSVSALVLFAVVSANGAGCSSPESYRAGHAGLSSGIAGSTAGSGGQAGLPGGTGGAVAGDTGASGMAGGLAGVGGGLAGDSGAAGTAGSGTAGGSGGSTAGSTGTGTAGTGAAGTGTAGTGAAGTGTGTAGTGAAGAGTAGTGTAGTTGSGTAGTGAAGTAPAAPLALPVTVSDHYRPTGGMGDAAVAGAVTITTDAAACTGAPAGVNQGACYTVAYQPQPFKAGANSTWAGFYWQYPDNNWGTLQPITIASGAKDVSIWAKGMAGGESISFEAGGIINQVSAATPYTDGFNVTQTFTLTKNWTKYTLPMTGMTYAGGVLGAFAWTAQVPNTNKVTFFLGGIVWE